MATLRVPDDVPTPRVDCERLRRAFQGFGTDENAIIKVLGRRNASQRKKIRETYQQLYNKSLIEDLQSELSGDFRNAVISWTYDPSERDARLANGVLKSRGKGVKELQILVEIACASSPHHLMAVRQAYASLFDHSLEEDITLNVPMPLQKILVNLVRSYRYDKELVDSDVANSEAARLYEVIKTKKLDEDDFILILSTRNVFQLKETFRFYEKNYGNPIDEVEDNRQLFVCPDTFLFLLSK
ncbi:OLC1v1024937C1 [Oldenlandia corymbosa var. corymbosa]|uniref:OLC1v1024937C1 n=1 Tax=Oldenlandia corymbosa var. corymbosa TaxID=529605 RepID=A0AAV1C5P7_OLDCO|nr:OLC1v1024937C1 [Oldenlandia corymbosa var. corymbosa]